MSIRNLYLKMRQTVLLSLKELGIKSHRESIPPGGTLIHKAGHRVSLTRKHAISMFVNHNRFPLETQHIRPYFTGVPFTYTHLQLRPDVLRLHSLCPAEDHGNPVGFVVRSLPRPADAVTTLKVVYLRSVGIKLSGQDDAGQFPVTSGRLRIWGPDAVKVAEEDARDTVAPQKQEGVSVGCEGAFDRCIHCLTTLCVVYADKGLQEFS